MTVTSISGKRLPDGERPLDAVSPQRKKACSHASPARQARVQRLDEHGQPAHDVSDAQVQQRKRLRLAKPTIAARQNTEAYQPADAPAAQAKKAKMQHEQPVCQPVKEPQVFMCMHTGEGLERDELAAATTAIDGALSAAAAQPPPRCSSGDAGQLPGALPAIQGDAVQQAAGDNSGADYGEEDWQVLFDGLRLGKGQRSGPSTPAKHEASPHDGCKRRGFLHGEFARVQRVLHH